MRYIRLIVKLHSRIQCVSFAPLQIPPLLYSDFPYDIPIPRDGPLFPTSQHENAKYSKARSSPARPELHNFVRSELKPDTGFEIRPAAQSTDQKRAFYRPNSDTASTAVITGIDIATDDAWNLNNASGGVVTPLSYFRQ